MGRSCFEATTHNKNWQTNHTCYAKVRGSCTRTISRTAYHTLCGTASTSSATSLPWNASHSPRLLGFGHYSGDCGTAHPVNSWPTGHVTQKRQKKGSRPLHPLPSLAAIFISPPLNKASLVRTVSFPASMFLLAESVSTISVCPRYSGSG
jgi:hypothetical protein